LRDTDFVHINHPRVATLYPEVAQWAFRIGFDRGLRTWKWMLLICDLASITLLAPLGLVVIVGFALNPLLIFEGVGRGHYEPIWLVLILLIWRCYQSFSLLKRNLDLSPGVVISIAMLVKPQAVLLAWPFLSKKLFGSTPKAVTVTDKLAHFGSWLQILMPIMVTTLWIAWKYGANLRAFIRGYQYNSWLPWLVANILHLPLKTPSLDALTPVLLLFVVMGLLWRGRHLTFASQALWLLGALLVGSKTFHPWYTLWLLPFAIMRFQLFWILLSWTQILGLWPYWLQSKGIPWHEISWLRWAILLPPLCISGMLWCWSIRKTKSNSKSYAS
jgi:hypothetical protein